jgi:hypothetical protein
LSDPIAMPIRMASGAATKALMPSPTCTAMTTAVKV